MFGFSSNVKTLKFWLSKKMFTVIKAGLLKLNLFSCASHLTRGACEASAAPSGESLP